MFALQFAQTILDDNRKQTIAYKNTQGAPVAWKREWIETPRGDHMLVEVVAFDFEIVYAFGPFMHPDYGMTCADTVSTTDYRTAIEMFVAAL